MSYQIQQSTTAWELLFLMVQSADHVTGLTGASPTVTIRKSAGAFGSPAGAVTEIANGWYKVAGNATDTNTLGPLLLHATAASGDPSDTSFEVVAFNPQSATLGLTVPTTAQIATGVWQDATAGDFTTASSIGKSLYTSGVVPGGAGGLFIAGSNAATTVNFTGNMSGSVGSVTGNVGGNVVGSVASVTGNVGGSVASVTGNVGGSVGSVTGNVGGNVVGSVASVTGNVGGNVVGTVASVVGNVGGNVVGSVASVTAAVTVDGASALTEAYPTKAGGLTLASALYGMNQMMGQQAITSTTLTVLKRDQSTTAMTFTLDSATSPTSITRAT